MKIAIIDNAHIVKTKDGKYYSKTIYSYDFFKRYLDSFSAVRFITKVKDLDSNFIDHDKYLRVDGPNVEIYEIPWYRGLKQMVSKIFKIRKAIRHSLDGYDGYVLRLAQVESYLFDLFAKKKNKSYIVELVNDPNLFMDMNFIFRKINVMFTKKIIKKAIGVSYVTEKYLQKKYPSIAHKTDYKKGFTSHYSSINLYNDQISEPKTEFFENEIIKIVHVSNSIESDIKGHSTVINVAKVLREKNIPIRVTFIGSGSQVPLFEKQIEKFNLQQDVKFIGSIADKKILLNKLRESDLMVLPTRLEGLPRVIIEAMAAGLPCISTSIAGIPELLDSNFLFNFNDYEGFAKKIIEMYNHPELMVEQSKLNVDKVKEYENSKLQKRRAEFYNLFKKHLEHTKVIV